MATTTVDDIRRREAERARVERREAAVGDCNRLVGLIANADGDRLLQLGAMLHERVDELVAEVSTLPRHRVA